MEDSSLLVWLAESLDQVTYLRSGTESAENKINIPVQYSEGGGEASDNCSASLVFENIPVFTSGLFADWLRGKD